MTLNATIDYFIVFKLLINRLMAALINISILTMDQMTYV